MTRRSPGVRSAVASLCLLGGLACAGIPSVGQEIVLPRQGLDVPVRSPELRRVVFFNSSERYWFWRGPSGKLNLLLDGRGLAALERDDYVQAFLPPGDYEVELSHMDFRTYRSRHRLVVGDAPVFVEVFPSATSHELVVHDEVPRGFQSRFRVGPEVWPGRLH